MARSDRKILAVKIAEAVIVSLVIWFLGWLMYDFVELWTYFTPTEMQHLLLALMTMVVLTSFELSRRAISFQDPQKSKRRANSPKPSQCPTDPRVPEMQEQLNELKEKVADIHAFEQIKKKRRRA